MYASISLCCTSLAMTRKYVCGPGYSEAVLMLIVGSLQTGTTAVRHGLVFEGLIKARWLVEATGISASATEELKGPTTPITVASEASAVMFAAPCCGS